VRFLFLLPLAVLIPGSVHAQASDIASGSSARVLLRASDRSWATGTIKTLANGCYVVVARPDGREPGGASILATVGYAARLQVRASRFEDWREIDQAPFRKDPRCVPNPGRG
jgi:hypothetical protein